MYIIFIILILTFLFTLFVTNRIMQRPVGTARMLEISEYIHEGALAFLYRQYKVLFYFVLVLAIILGLFLDNASTTVHEGILTAVSFVIGALCSVVAGYRGMKIATKANVRSAYAVKKSITEGLKVAFSSGSVMGLSVVILGLGGLSVLYSVYVLLFGLSPESYIQIITGFALGASSIALFARVGGGIYTKAADVGADLVGKVEKNIPEDDPRNPAVIADNVGDNVGDVAGMGADLFESFVGSIIAAMTLGYIKYGVNGIMFPLIVATAGIVASMAGILYVKTSKEQKRVDMVLVRGFIITTVVALVLDFFITRNMFVEPTGIFVSLVVGLSSGLFIGVLTDYYTSNKFHPVQEIAKASQTGPATVIIEGLSLGYISTALQVIGIVGAIYLSYDFGGLYGISLAAVGMLSTLAYTLATDAYGAVSDNAGGIAEMAKLGKKVRDRTDELDALGNTTAAIGKGFAIGSAALTALALFSAFTVAAGIITIDIMNPRVIIGLFIGGMLPFVFSALTMRAVGKVAFIVIQEVRRQFRTIKGLMKGKAKPQYHKCIDIVTKGAIREMIAPGLLAVLAPLVVGFFLGASALAGLLAGSLVTGVLLAISMATSGGAWDNAKKYIEAGHLGGKGSDNHKASVVGDTLGDPFKDTSGPSLNILIKLMSIVALVFASLFTVI